MSLILADTGGLYSLLNRKDAHHAEAMAFYAKQKWWWLNTFW